jgi:hypothetical protein
LYRHLKARNGETRERCKLFFQIIKLWQHFLRGFLQMLKCFSIYKKKKKKNEVSQHNLWHNDTNSKYLSLCKDIGELQFTEYNSKSIATDILTLNPLIYHKSQCWSWDRPLLHTKKLL